MSSNVFTGWNLSHERDWNISKWLREVLIWLTQYLNAIDFSLLYVWISYEKFKRDDLKWKFHIYFKPNHAYAMNMPNIAGVERS